MLEVTAPKGKKIWGVSPHGSSGGDQLSTWCRAGFVRGLGLQPLSAPHETWLTPTKDQKIS